MSNNKQSCPALEVLVSKFDRRIQAAFYNATGDYRREFIAAIEIFAEEIRTYGNSYTLQSIQEAFDLPGDVIKPFIDTLFEVQVNKEDFDGALHTLEEFDLDNGREGEIAMDSYRQSMERGYFSQAVNTALKYDLSLECKLEAASKNARSSLKGFEDREPGVMWHHGNVESASQSIDSLVERGAISKDQVDSIVVETFDKSLDKGNVKMAIALANFFSLPSNLVYSQVERTFKRLHKNALKRKSDNNVGYLYQKVLRLGSYFSLPESDLRIVAEDFFNYSMDQGRFRDAAKVVKSFSIPKKYYLPRVEGEYRRRLESAEGDFEKLRGVLEYVSEFDMGTKYLSEVASKATKAWVRMPVGSRNCYRGFYDRDVSPHTSDANKVRIATYEANRILHDLKTDSKKSRGYNELIQVIKEFGLPADKFTDKAEKILRTYLERGQYSRCLAVVSDFELDSELARNLLQIDEYVSTGKDALQERSQNVFFFGFH